MDDDRRVVVTGIGVLSACGVNEAELWDNMMAGRSGIAELEAFDTSGYKVKIGAEVDDERLQPMIEALGRRPVDRAHDLALVASAQALEQSGLVTGPPPHEEQDVAVIFGTGVGSAQSHFNAFTAFSNKGVRGLRPTTVPRCMYNAISAGISIRFNLTGSNFVVVSACTASTNAIGAAFRQVRDGHADIVLCGGSDAFFDPFFFGVWNNLGVLSKIPEPAAACRPFDSDRKGLVLGEGAGALVLETLSSATRRGARIRGEIAGYGESSDATHITSPSAEGQAKAIRRALDSAGMSPRDVGFINAHGTATAQNDVCESKSIRAVFGEAASSVPVASNKSYFGHTLGASGAIETIVTLLGLEAGRMPPNLNLENPDPECDVLLVGGEPQELSSAVAMKNSFGFGGCNAVLILKRYDDEGGRHDA
jgi:3-oxoacyl-[acyl-carrier-protein] synthase II